MDELLSVQRASRTFGRAPNEVLALDDADLTVGAGEIVAVMGPSGSGWAPGSMPSPTTSAAGSSNGWPPNGVRHGPTGSTVVVDVASIDADRVEIAVTDQGPGIAPEDQAAIFERYWRGHDSDGGGGGGQPGEDGDGSGLGLAIVRQVAVAHGGSVGVESPVADGQGTRLRLILLS